MLSQPGRARFRSVATEDSVHPANHHGSSAGFDNGYKGYGGYSETVVPSAQIQQGVVPEPATLQPSRRRWGTLVACLLGIVPFFCLAWAAVGLHNHKITTKNWDALQTAMKVEVTLFPLVFAAIVGRMTRQLAHWRLQKGASVSNLQRLLGSNTVFGNIYTSWVLRSVTFLGLGLGLIWALSPLAAQSSLRVLSASYEEIHYDIQQQYLNVSATAHAQSTSSWSWKNDPADEIFTAGLVTSKLTKGLSTDLWGNVKLPLLSSLTDSDTSTDWIDVNEDKVVYSSQIGLPVFGFLANGSTMTTIKAAYIELPCRHLMNITFKSANVSFTNMPQLSYVNETAGTPVVSWKSFFFEDGMVNSNNDVSATTCSLNPVNVELAVQCNRQSTVLLNEGNCATQRIRRDISNKEVLPSVLTSNDTFNAFGRSILASMPEGHVAYTTVLDLWMNDPYTPYDLSANISLTNLDSTTFSQRLTQLVNSFYMSRLGYKFITRSSLDGLQFDHSSNNDTILIRSDAGNAYFESSEGKGVNINPELTLHANAGWISAFILTIIVMIASAFTTFFISSATIIPDILGFVSSLTRDNAHVPFDEVPGSMGGVQRSRLLGSISLRLGDVSPGDDLGTLAVGQASSTSRSKARREFR